METSYFESRSRRMATRGKKGKINRERKAEGNRDSSFDAVFHSSTFTFRFSLTSKWDMTSQILETYCGFL